MMPLLKYATLITLSALVFSLPGVADDKPLKIYILVGQSNMLGQATPSTFPDMAATPATKALHDKFVDADGEPRIYNNVRVAALSRGGEKIGPLTVGFGARADRFGPELGFGVAIYEAFNEPVLIIKASWGGKNLSNDFRSPSAGPYEYNEKQKGNWSEERRRKYSENTGHYYRLMVEHVKKVLADPGAYHPAFNKAAGYEIEGFVWFQGWNDMIDGDTYPDRGKSGSYKLYSTCLVHLIRDVRKEFKAPKMPFIIGVLGVDGEPEREDPFRQAMAAPAVMDEFSGNVIAVHTAPFWDEQLEEVSMRLWRVRHRNADKKKQYDALREKVRPLLHAESEARKLEGPERNKKLNEIKSQLESIVYTREELEMIKRGVSNGPYHYLGAAKIYGAIGEAFAKALIR